TNDSDNIHQPSLSLPFDTQWVLLQHHPVSSSLFATTKMAMNIVAWDGASRLYYWDSDKKCMHRISLGEPEPNTILAASPSKNFKLLNVHLIEVWSVLQNCVDMHNNYMWATMLINGISAGFYSDDHGPLRNLCLSEGPDDEINAARCEGRAVSFLYDMISKDTILSGNLASRPHLSVDVNNVVGVANSIRTQIVLFAGTATHSTEAAIVDLALPNRSETLITMIYCLHNGGIDSIILHFLLFTYQSTGKDDKMRSSLWNPVLSTPEGEISSSSGLHALSYPFGGSWIVNSYFSHECMVLTTSTMALRQYFASVSSKYTPFSFDSLKVCQPSSVFQAFPGTLHLICT
ncbi:hypothetical protein Leryth_015597, partial [Lithospermum erythrorhizon]